MKSDRELLELAARAVGIVGVWHERGQCILVTNCGGLSDMWWRPQNDDGDALRLAVKLGLIVDVDTANCATTVDYTAGEDFVLCEGHGIDSLKATRRAIVRAAAAIGESMQ